MTEQEIKTLLNQVLKDLFFKILRLQERNVSRSANDTISRTEMHILEIIQDTPGATITFIADELGVAKATASVSVTRLAKKHYIEKVKPGHDRRKSLLKLTQSGEFCCRKHQQFHDMMVQSILKEFNIAEHPMVLQSLRALLDFFSRLEQA